MSAVAQKTRIFKWKINIFPSKLVETIVRSFNGRVLQAQMRSLQIQNSFYFDPHWHAEKKNSTTMPHSERQQLNVNLGDKRSRILAILAAVERYL